MKPSSSQRCQEEVDDSSTWVMEAECSHQSEISLRHWFGLGSWSGNFSHGQSCRDISLTVHFFKIGAMFSHKKHDWWSQCWSGKQGGDPRCCLRRSLFSSQFLYIPQQHVSWCFTFNFFWHSLPSEWGYLQTCDTLTSGRSSFWRWMDELISSLFFNLPLTRKGSHWGTMFPGSPGKTDGKELNITQTVMH